MNATLRLGIPALGLLLALGLSACGSDEPPAPQETPAVPVRMAQAAWTSWPQVYPYSGTVQGARKVQLSTRMLGRISYFPVEEGDRVRRGQVLARIQSQDVQAQQTQVEANLREAEAALASAETNFQRMSALFEAESATKKEYEDATTHLEVSKARVAALQARLVEIEDALGYADVVAPIDGYVVEKRAEQGGMATPGMPLLVVEDTQQLEVVAQVPESDIGRFALGDTVAIEVNALRALTRQGVVTQVNPAGNAASRQFQVTVKMTPGEPDGVAIKSGMYARVVLTQGERSMIAVPEEVLVHRGQLTGLYTVSSRDQALLRWVRTGKRYGGHVEILSGLTEGETYITGYDGRLADGQPVRAMQ